MTYERLVDIIALKLTVDKWHITDYTDNGLGDDTEAMRQSIQQLAQIIATELVETEEDG